MKSRLILSFLFIFLSSFPILFALEIPQRPEGYVSDYAGMISPETRFEIEETLQRFESETSNQVVVVTFPSLDGESLEDFSIRLAEAWKIGQRGKDNGVILLIFKKDRRVRIEVGYGLEGALPDALAKFIIDNEIAPRFRQGDFDLGVLKAVEAITAATRGEYQPRPHKRASQSAFMTLASFLGFAVMFFFSVLPIFVFWIFFVLGCGFFIFGLMTQALLTPFYGLFSLVMLALILQRVFGATVVSRRGSHWSLGGFGGGGFSGGGFSGGGGGFGGGGASGRW